MSMARSSRTAEAFAAQRYTSRSQGRGRAGGQINPIGGTISPSYFEYTTWHTDAHFSSSIQLVNHETSWRLRRALERDVTSGRFEIGYKEKAQGGDYKETITRALAVCTSFRLSLSFMIRYLSKCNYQWLKWYSLITQGDITQLLHFILHCITLYFCHCYPDASVK